MACLDVGSDTVKLVVGEMVKKKLNILAVCDEPSRGVKNGLIEDPNLLIKSLENDLFNICFVDVRENLERIYSELLTRDYYTKTTYYRLFIAPTRLLPISILYNSEISPSMIVSESKYKILSNWGNNPAINKR